MLAFASSPRLFGSLLYQHSVRCLRATGRPLGLLLLSACSSAGCQGGENTPSDGAGGAPSASGGAAVGTGGGSSTSGGSDGSGGTASGGNAAGGSASGGEDNRGSGGATVGPACKDGLLLCDDFEGTSIDTALWAVGKSGANVVELSTEYAARGAQSVHIHTEGAFGYVKNTSIFPVANNDYFGRMFLRVARYSTVDWAHWTVAEAAGTGNDSVVRVGGQYLTDKEENRYGVGSDGGPTGDWTRHDTDPGGQPQEPTLGAWVCLEWEHKGSTNETHMYIDGELHPSLSTTATDHDGTSGAEYILPNVTSFWFGFWQYQADPEPFDIWIDAVALDDERIGCGAE